MVVAVLGVACGKKGPPQPPIRLIPAPGKDLTAQQQGDDVLLRVKYPSTAVNGMALPGLEAVEVWRMSRPAPESGEVPTLAEAEFKAAARKALTLSGGELVSAVAGDRLLLRTALPETVEPPEPVKPPEAEEAPQAGAPSQALGYAVVFVSTGEERSAFSNVVALLPREPPPPPGGLTVEGRPRGVEVSWQAPEAGVAGFRVYRRAAEQRTYGASIGEVKPEETSFLDLGARFGQRYIYSVTAVSEAEPPVESATTAEREIDYRDRFPPPPPAGLVALTEPGRVRLRWRASAAPDLAGYHVYRLDPGAQERRRLTSEPIRTLEFLDTGLAPGRTYAYRLTAVDAEGNEGVPGEEVEVQVR